MAPIIEILAQILWLTLAIWLIYRAYQANKKAESFSLRSHLQGHDFSTGLNAMFMAGGLVIGIVLLILLAHKLVTCGVLCWS
jgi:hypothetical protein